MPEMRHGECGLIFVPVDHSQYRWKFHILNPDGNFARLFDMESGTGKQDQMQDGKREHQYSATSRLNMVESNSSAGLLFTSSSARLLGIPEINDNAAKGIYTSLKNNEFRLVTLRAGEWKDPISCYLEVLDFEADNRYEALSYVWGSPNSFIGIQLHGQSFQITNNLFEALRHIRHRNRDRLLWIDAQAINQVDISE